MDWQDCKLCIGLCNNQDKVDSSFFWNFLELLKPKQHIVIRGQSTIKAASLNEILKEAVKWGCHKILYMDIDQEFPVDTIPRLITRNLPIVSGLYHLKSPPFSPIAGWKRKRKQGNSKYVNGNGLYWKENYCKFPDNENHLVEVDWVGIGCLLIDMDVFNKMYYPPFRDTWNKEKGVRQKGHDIVFCEDAKKAGYKVYVDTTVQCVHMGKVAVTDVWVDAYYNADVDSQLSRLVKERAQSSLYWDQRHFHDFSIGLKRTYSASWDCMVENIKEKSSVADVGCGPGFLMERMRDEKQCECYGYDISQVAIARIKKKGFDGEVVDFREFKPNGKLFDYVVSSHLIEHLEDDEGALRRMASVLKNGSGKVLVSVPTKDVSDIAGIEHQRVYSEESLKLVMSKVFKNVDVIVKHTEPKNTHLPMLVGIGSHPHGI